MAYYLTHTGAELDAAIDRIQAQTKLSAITLTASNITTAGSAFSVTPGAKYTAAGESLAINLGNDLKSTLIASNIKSGVSILGVTGTYSAAVGTWEYGTNATATLYDDGTFVVSGYGTGYNYRLDSAVPWKRYRSQITSLYFDSRITVVGDRNFYGCANLVHAALPSGITGIGDATFNGCTSLALTALPSGITGIGQAAFGSCTNLALTALPSGLAYMGELVFNGCTSLALTTLPSGITSVGSYTFLGCTGLTSMTFESTLTSIASDAFSSCTNLTNIYVPWASGAVSGAPWGATNATIHYNTTT